MSNNILEQIAAYQISSMGNETEAVALLGKAADRIEALEKALRERVALVKALRERVMLMARALPELRSGVRSGGTKRLADEIAHAIWNGPDLSEGK